MTVVWLKTAHIASLVVWCGCLLVIPGLFAQRQGISHDPTRFDLQRLTRFLFVTIASPAAFVAIGTGTALIFVREVFTAWFALKLLVVGGLAAMHVRHGFVVLQVFQPSGTYRPWRKVAATGLTLGLIGAILWLVLEKPAVDLALLPDWLHQPGGLRTMVEDLIRHWIS
ncbi:CopD family protein [Skermanella rosea]|uniref:CopD family protein n=1 Tax=Skermanella rosea TaxID=1817965 RepID=UPI0019334BB0|nr:CopD family protein [Skermanella rosea]UEM01342.1 CopD family protein [Skermanella rosea]